MSKEMECYGLLYVEDSQECKLCDLRKDCQKTDCVITYHKTTNNGKHSNWLVRDEFLGFHREKFGDKRYRRSLSKEDIYPVAKKLAKKYKFILDIRSDLPKFRTLEGVTAIILYPSIGKIFTAYPVVKLLGDWNRVDEFEDTIRQLQEKISEDFRDKISNKYKDVHKYTGLLGRLQ